MSSIEVELDHLVHTGELSRAGRLKSPDEDPQDSAPDAP